MMDPNRGDDPQGYDVEIGDGEWDTFYTTQRSGTVHSYTGEEYELTTTKSPRTGTDDPDRLLAFLVPAL